MIGRVARGIGQNAAIVTNSSSMMGTMAVTSVLGFIFWWVAARQFDAVEVGTAAASISAMNLLASVSMLGLGTLLVSELAKQTNERNTLVFQVLLLVTISGSVLGVISAVAAPIISDDLQPFANDWMAVALFASGVALTAISGVADQALIGRSRGGWQLARNSVFAVVKLVALFVIAIVVERRSGIGIYATWVIGQAISIIVLFMIVRRFGRLPAIGRPRGLTLGELGKKGLSHHVLNLSLQGPHLMLPLVVITILTAADNAYFYTVWMVLAFVFVIPFALTFTLYAVGSSQPESLTDKSRFTLSVAFVTCMAAVLLIQISAEHIMLVFGPAYSENASESLRILSLGVFANIIKDHYVAILRVHNRINRASLVIIFSSSFELICAAIGASIGGLRGLSLGWVMGVSVASVLMAPAVWRVAFPKHLNSS